MPEPDDATPPVGLLPAVAFEYRNHRGVEATRRVHPVRILYGRTEWHREEQWLMEAWDAERRATRTFAMQDIRGWRAAP